MGRYIASCPIAVSYRISVMLMVLYLKTSDERFLSCETSTDMRSVPNYNKGVALQGAIIETTTLIALLMKLMLINTMREFIFIDLYSTYDE